ncbi:hypothetical protein E4T42_06150 [Aureobasidium subglaciale]|nr:hypothetical protein E4T42_06150 [Aureobasidium subglaciale]
MYTSTARLYDRQSRSISRHIDLFAGGHQRLPRAIAPQVVRQFSATSTLSNAAPSPSLPDNHEYFNFTRGRFLGNEKYELQRRHRKFDVYELMRVAARAVGANYCTNIQKCPDGMYNRILHLSMDNGKQVIAKIPNPNSGPPHFTTASEVATMQFVREVLRTPVPEVYAWSSRAHETTIGAEYIIMEKMEGVTWKQLSPSMSLADQIAVVKSVAEYRVAWSSVVFEQYGSLYFAKDVKNLDLPALRYTTDLDGPVVDARFVIGPCCTRSLFQAGRETVELDRGPWSSIREFNLANAQRELTCLHNVATLPQTHLALCGPGLHRPRRDIKINVLEVYLGILESIELQDSVMNAPHIAHDDLRSENILLTPGNQIAGVLDWQSTTITPLYDNNSPTWPMENPPQLLDSESLLLTPDPNLHALLLEKRQRSISLKESLDAAYRAHLRARSTPLHDYLDLEENDPRIVVLRIVSEVFYDGESFAFSICMMMADEETLLGAQGVAWPVEFCDKSKKLIVEASHKYAASNQMMTEIHEQLDFLSLAGWVPHSHYDSVTSRLSEIADLVIEKFADDSEDAAEWKNSWPFRRD